VKYQIKGETLPYVACRLSKGESVFTESGGMAWMSENIKMETNMRGGIGGAIGRAFSGESLFLVNYLATEDNAEIGFTSEFPGKIIEFKLSGNEIICQRDAFMFAETGVELKVHLRKKLGMSMFGGEGFVLQKLTGKGLAFVEIAGSVEMRELDKGENLVVDTGYVAAYEATVSSEIKMVKGFKNILFGGEGLFLTKLTGPGKVWLQSMPVTELSKKILKYIPKN